MAQQPDQDPEAALIATYVLAEQTLLEGVARILRKPVTTYTEQLAAVVQIRQLAQHVLTELGDRTPPLVQAVIQSVVDRGVREAIPETVRSHVEQPIIRAHTTPTAHQTTAHGLTVTTAPRTRPEPDPFDFAMSQGQRSAQAILHDLTSELDDVRSRITRLPDDIYKIIAPQGAIQQVLGHELTAKDAQAQAYREFIRRGVTGFTDKGGREWSLSAYTEMAVRTAANRAYNASSLAVMQAAGIELFTVDDDGHPCPLCFPWQGKILSVKPDPRADATIAEATAAGLWHPHCRHHLRAHIPGITRPLHPKRWTQADQDAYRATQRQRSYELEIRKAKKILEYANDPDTILDAKAAIKRNQAHIRDLLADKHLNLKRQSRREQPNLSLDRTPTQGVSS